MRIRREYLEKITREGVRRFVRSLLVPGYPIWANQVTTETSCVNLEDRS